MCQESYETRIPSTSQTFSTTQIKRTNRSVNSSECKSSLPVTDTITLVLLLSALPALLQKRQDGVFLLVPKNSSCDMQIVCARNDGQRSTLKTRVQSCIGV